jgi:lysophospholipase L1-like esterase
MALLEKMMSQAYRKRLAMLAGVTVVTLILLEIVLRFAVPISSMVDRNNLYPVAWYLDHSKSLESQSSHPTYTSDEVLGWAYAKNIRQPKLSTNSHGLRGRSEYSIARKPNTRRVVVLGDSYSAGYGVADHETYATQLEAALPNSEFPNLAVPGYGVDQAVLRWEKMGQAYSPDVVILGVYIPDFHRNALVQWFGTPKPRFKVVSGGLHLPSEPLPPIDDVAANLQRVRAELADLLRMPRVWIATRYLHQRVSGKLSGWREPDETFEEKRQLLQLLIARLAEDCKTRGVRLVLVNILTEYDEYPDEVRILEIIKQSAFDNEVAVLTLDRFLGASNDERAQMPVFDAETGHWSAYGHQLAAESIAQFLLEKNILQR